jgi:hypothetical protein
VQTHNCCVKATAIVALSQQHPLPARTASSQGARPVTPGRHPLFSEKGKNQGKKEGKKDAGGKGKVEREIFTLDGNITREPAEPGNFIGEKQEDTQCGHQTAEND